MILNEVKNMEQNKGGKTAKIKYILKNFSVIWRKKSNWKEDENGEW